jgi:hypothetical protein
MMILTEKADCAGKGIKNLIDWITQFSEEKINNEVRKILEQILNFAHRERRYEELDMNLIQLIQVLKDYPDIVEKHYISILRYLKNFQGDCLDEKNFYLNSLFDQPRNHPVANEDKHVILQNCKQLVVKYSYQAYVRSLLSHKNVNYLLNHYSIQDLKVLGAVRLVPTSTANSKLGPFFKVLDKHEYVCRKIRATGTRDIKKFEIMRKQYVKDRRELFEQCKKEIKNGLQEVVGELAHNVTTAMAESYRNARPVLNIITTLFLINISLCLFQIYFAKEK